MFDFDGDGWVEAEGLVEDGVGVGEGGWGEEGWVEGKPRGGGFLLLLILLVVGFEEVVDLTSDFGVDIAMLHEEVEGPG